MDLTINDWIGIIGFLVAIEMAIGHGTISLTSAIPDKWIPTVQAWCNIFAFVGASMVTALSRLAAVVLLAILLMPAPARAQGVKLVPPTGNIVNDINAARARGIQSGNDVKLTGDPIADLHAAIQKQGAKLIMHLKQSYALAMAKGTGGSAADNTSAMCTKALVPIVSLVVNGPPAGTLDAADPMTLTTDEARMAADTGEPEGVVVKVEKLRILRLALTSPALNDACGALVQDEVKNAQNLVGKITSLITGAGLAGIGL